MQNNLACVGAELEKDRSKIVEIRRGEQVIWKLMVPPLS